jgi:transcriptional regulator of arginine metabolism
MSTKTERQKAELELIAQHAVATQGELRALLRGRGIEADQATLSRDIRELGVVKVSDDGRSYRYAPVETVAPPLHTKASALVARLVRKADASGNLVVLKTDIGEASAVGAALDRLGWSEIVGTVAGDDTLLVVVKEGASSRRLVKRILDLKAHKKDTA